MNESINDASKTQIQNAQRAPTIAQIFLSSQGSVHLFNPRFTKVVLQIISRQFCFSKWRLFNTNRSNQCSKEVSGCQLQLIQQTETTAGPYSLLQLQVRDLSHTLRLMIPSAILGGIKLSVLMEALYLSLLSSSSTFNVL